MDSALISSFFAILTAIIASFASSTFYKRQVKADLQKEYASRFNERKWETYTDFSAMVFRIFEDTKNKRLNTKQYASEMHRFAGSLWIVCSDRVIGAYVDWQRFTFDVPRGERQDTDYLTLRKLARIVIEMRRDLGYLDDRATEIDLLSTIFPEIRNQETL